MTTPDLTIDILNASEDSDSCIVQLNRSVAPDESVLYSSAAEAAAEPLVAALFAVPQVDAVLAKGSMLIISRSRGPWPPIVEGIRQAVEDHHEGRATAPGKADERSIWDKVWQVLDTQVNPAVAGHGGSIDLLEVDGTEITLQMNGGCQGCGMAAVTLRQGVQEAIREAVPEVTEIHDSTDHDAGVSPYFG